jgi:hypothetical protein
MFTVRTLCNMLASCIDCGYTLSQPGMCIVLYGSTSGAGGGKCSTASLGGNSYEAEEYSYVLSGDPGDGGGGSGFEMSGQGTEDSRAQMSFSGGRPLTACGKSPL